MRLRFPHTARLTRASEFRQVRTRGKSYPGRYLVLGVLTGMPEQSVRGGVITTRRLGNAVQRNRVRRRFREIFRLHRQEIKDGVWLVMVARGKVVQASFEAIEREWLLLANRASIFAAQ